MSLKQDCKAVILYGLFCFESTYIYANVNTGLYISSSRIILCLQHDIYNNNNTNIMLDIKKGISADTHFVNISISVYMIYFSIIMKKY